PRMLPLSLLILFFFTATPTPEIYTLSLHDALPISLGSVEIWCRARSQDGKRCFRPQKWLHRRSCRAKESIGAYTYGNANNAATRSEEHTSELQSRGHLVCRLLLEKKNKELQDRTR